MRVDIEDVDDIKIPYRIRQWTNDLGLDADAIKSLEALDHLFLESTLAIEEKVTDDDSDLDWGHSCST